MIGGYAHRAETLRLARVLGVDPTELDMLADAPVEALRELRGTISDRLLERSRREFERAVALADSIPRGLSATLSQKAMGPVLGGRAAALLSPEMAADLAKRLPAEYLAEVATHVDLRHVGPLIGDIPTETMAEAGRVLREREEWIVLAAFVGHVPPAKLESLLALFDGEALLRAGFVVEDPSRLDAAIELLPTARLDELLVAAHEHDLWAEAIVLSATIGPAQADRIVDAIDRCPPGHVDELLVAAGDNGLWPEAIAVASHAGAHQGDEVIAAIERLDDVRREGLAAVLREDDELRAAASALIARAPRELRALVG